MRAGLQRVLTDVPLRAGYVELGGSITAQRGAEAWAEAGYHPLPGVAVFGRGFATTKDAGAMAGARWEF